MFRSFRNTLYRLASLLGDFEALISLSPRKIIARFIRKKIYKSGGPFINKKIR